MRRRRNKSDKNTTRPTGTKQEVDPLATIPELARDVIASGARAPNFRGWPAIAYRVEDTVELLRIFHARRALGLEETKWRVRTQRVLRMVVRVDNVNAAMTEKL